VLDCFCGSGTTLAAAQQNNRRWIGIDQSDLAIATAQKKLMTLTGTMPEITTSEAIHSKAFVNYSYLIDDLPESKQLVLFEKGAKYRTKKKTKK